MYHFFVGQDQIEGEWITVTGPDVNHIKNVLRMRPGEQVLISGRTAGEHLEASGGRLRETRDRFQAPGDRLCDTDAHRCGTRDYLCEAEVITSEQVRFHILEEKEESTELSAQVHLYQGLPKGDKMELIVQKAVELGAFRVVPTGARRTVVKLDAKKEETRVKRWNAIAESAAKQSKRGLIPEVSRVLSFQEALEEVEDFDLKLIPYECADGIGRTRELLETAAPGMRIAVFIGPEGGFEEQEIALAREYGVEPITLGRRILRTETAGLCVLSALMLRLEA